MMYKWFKKNALWVFGIIISIVSTIVLTLFFKDKANLEVRLIAKVNVVDIKENVNALSILYDGIDLKQSKQMLTLYNIEFINSGNVPIKVADYDVEKVGIKVIGGKFIEKPVLVEPTSKYFKQNIKIKYDSSHFYFEPILFNENDVVALKLLVLHQDTCTPRIMPRGKIAGQQHIDVVRHVKMKGTVDVDEYIFMSCIALIAIAIAILLASFLTTQKTNKALNETRQVAEQLSRSIKPYLVLVLPKSREKNSELMSNLNNKYGSFYQEGDNICWNLGYRMDLELMNELTEMLRKRGEGKPQIEGRPKELNDMYIVKKI